MAAHIHCQQVDMEGGWCQNRESGKQCVLAAVSIDQWKANDVISGKHGAKHERGRGSNGAVCCELIYTAPLCKSAQWSCVLDC